MQKEYKVIVEYRDNKVFFTQWLNQQGQLHREDGPASEWANGTKEWWLNGKQFTEKEFLQQTQSLPSYEGKVVEIDGKKYRLIASRESIGPM